jgi:hypothetical protein
MSSMMSTPFANNRPSAGDDLFIDYRQRRAQEENERADLKRVDQAEQCSGSNTADRRIRAWEKVHHLRMPSDPQHPALSAIAAATQLTLADIRNEQRLRSARCASAGV